MCIRDRVNTTLNSGRILITLKPLSERHIRVEEIIRRISANTRSVAGISLYMQPIQDLTVEGTVSRTQYQFMLSTPDMSLLSQWVPRLVERLRDVPVLADVASDLQDQGLQAYIQIDRDAAGRLGVTVAAIDNVLYDTYGQRLISTIFTQSNQYLSLIHI